MAENGGAILLSILVTLGALGAAVYLERKARSVGPLRSAPPWDDVAPGPQGTLVLSLASMSGYKAFRSPYLPGAGGSRAEVESRVRSVVLVKLTEKLNRGQDEVLRLARDGAPEVPHEARSFLAGEPAETRWRRRAASRYRGPRALFGPWFRFVFLRRMTPPERALVDLDLILSSVEADSP